MPSIRINILLRLQFYGNSVTATGLEPTTTQFVNDHSTIWPKWKIVDVNKPVNEEKLPKVFVEYLKRNFENQQINAFKFISGNFQITMDKIKLMQEGITYLKK